MAYTQIHTQREGKRDKKVLAFAKKIRSLERNTDTHVAVPSLSAHSVCVQPMHFVLSVHTRSYTIVPSPFSTVFALTHTHHATERSHR